ncbi:MAG: type II secretion system protein [Candidatus Omnitrophota bacterium]
MLFIPDFRFKKLFRVKSVNINSANKKAFTLVEVLVSSVILSVGLVIIFEVFLSSLDIVNLVNNRLNAQLFINEKIWQLQSNLDRQSGMFIPMKQSGSVMLGNKEFKWQLDMELVDISQELYKVSGQMNWLSGSKQKMIKRQVMVKSCFSNANPWKDHNRL